MRVRITNLPENAVFADILIRINERDPNFTAVNEYNLALFGLDAHAGNVLSVSAEFSLPSPRKGVWISGSALDDVVWYNHDTSEIEVHLRPVRYNYLGSILRPIFFDSPILVLGVIALFSVILELAAGLCLGFRRKKLIPIVLANLLTQAVIAMFSFIWLFHQDFFFGNLFSFFLTAMLLTVGIYTAEFLIYRKSPVMKDISTRKILQYTITANTLSFAFLAAAFFMVHIVR